VSERPWSELDLVLDTNVLIYLSRADATGRWLHSTFLAARESAPIVSVVAVAEARQFARAHEWTLEKNERLRKILRRCIVRDVTEDDVSLIEAYIELDGESRRLGHRMGKNDLWIAAETRRLGAVLLTSDRDFERVAAAGHVSVDRFESLLIR
jgi:tRNA(fMet)-specific endonuclease VapC